MEHKLRQMPDGTWYRFGEGAPRNATDDEVALWQSAQEAALNDVSSPRRWGQLLAEVAKMGTLIAAVATFLVMFGQWVQVLNYHNRLGTTELAFSEFSSMPIPFDAIMSTVICGSMLLLASTLAYLPHVIIDWFVPEKWHRWTRLPIHLASLLLPLGLALRLHARTDPGDFEVLTQITFDVLIGLACVMPVISWSIGIWIDYSNGRRELSAQVVALSSMAICLYMMFTFLVVPLDVGGLRASQVLEGRAKGRAVSLLASYPLPISQEVPSTGERDNAFLYASVPITHELSGEQVYSLQLIGQTADAVFVYDAEHSLIHRIPHSAILNLVIHPMVPDHPSDRRYNEEPCCGISPLVVTPDLVSGTPVTITGTTAPP